MATLPFRSRTYVGWGILIVGLGVLPLVVGDSIIFLTTDFLAMALFAMGYNLLFGLTGLLSFGHAVYFGLGAYTVALLYDKLSIGLVQGIFLAPVVAALFATIIGFFCVRVAGVLFGMLTMAFGQLVYTVVYGWYSFTGGDNGLLFTPPDYLLPAANYYYFTLLFVAVSVGILRMITVSSFGAALMAIRENSERAAFIGINVKAYQLAAFVISGAFVGVAGALRAPLQHMACPSMLYWAQSADPLLMSLTGGFLTFAGPIVGAAIFVFLNFIVTVHFGYPMLAFGILVLLVVLFLRGGIVGFIEELARRSESTSKNTVEAARASR